MSDLTEQQRVELERARATRKKRVESVRRWQQKNPEKTNSYRRKHYQTHKEQHAARSRKYREAHRDELRAYGRAYYQAHREQILFKSKLRRCGLDPSQAPTEVER